MKLYKKPETPYLLRITIKKQGDITRYITVSDATIDDAIKRIYWQLLKKHVYGPKKGKYLNIAVREEIHTKNGKTKSISLYGKTTLQIYNIVVKLITLTEI